MVDPPFHVPYLSTAFKWGMCHKITLEVMCAGQHQGFFNDAPDYCLALVEVGLLCEQGPLILSQESGHDCKLLLSGVEAASVSLATPSMCHRSLAAFLTT